MSKVQDQTVLVVSSSDKYEDTWYPYFELIKKYWPQHPHQICLITETKQCHIDGLNIRVFNYEAQYSWSERLYRTLEQLDAKYIIFSLEDFFLLGSVDNGQIERCLEWMEQDADIVQCRLYACDDDTLTEDERYAPFRWVNNDTRYLRADTQAAVWKRTELMQLIDLRENPWQFEINASTRIKQTDKKQLWYYLEDQSDIKKQVFPYHMKAVLGYGVAWGHWLWNNRKWFEQNGIHGVKYHRLGVLSERVVKARWNHLYTQHPTRMDKIIKPFWRGIVKVRKIKSNICVWGWKKGLQITWKQK